VYSTLLCEHFILILRRKVVLLTNDYRGAQSLRHALVLSPPFWMLLVMTGSSDKFSINLGLTSCRLYHFAMAAAAEGPCAERGFVETCRFDFGCHHQPCAPSNDLLPVRLYFSYSKSRRFRHIPRLIAAQARRSQAASCGYQYTPYKIGTGSRLLAFLMRRASRSLYQKQAIGPTRELWNLPLPSGFVGLRVSVCSVLFLYSDELCSWPLVRLLCLVLDVGWLIYGLGSGIGPCAPCILEQRVPIRLLWTSPNVRETVRIYSHYITQVLILG
jgi:hypothetical protein